MNKHNNDDKEAIPANDQDRPEKPPEAVESDGGNQTTAMVVWTPPSSIIDPPTGSGTALVEQNRAAVALTKDNLSLPYKLAGGAAGVVLGGLLVRQLMRK